MWDPKEWWWEWMGPNNLKIIERMLDDTKLATKYASFLAFPLPLNARAFLALWLHPSLPRGTRHSTLSSSSLHLSFLFKNEKTIKNWKSIRIVLVNIPPPITIPLAPFLIYLWRRFCVSLLEILQLSNSSLAVLRKFRLSYNLQFPLPSIYILYSSCLNFNYKTTLSSLRKS